MTHPSFSNVRAKVRQLFLELGIQCFPVSPIALFEKMNIPLVSFSKLLSDGHADTVWDWRSRKIEALCWKQGFQYIVFYDDETPFPDRVPFTLAHELGHIYLNHHCKSDGSPIPRMVKTFRFDFRESEADEFAGELLAPVAILHLSRITSPWLVQRCYRVSNVCARVRIGKLEASTHDGRLYNHPLPFFLEQFHDYLFNCYCPHCQSMFVDKANFCPICGGKNLIWGNFMLPYFDKWQKTKKGRVPTMEYKTIDCDEALHVLSCPRCGNSKIPSNYNYCPICGLPTTNRCYGKNSGHLDHQNNPIYNESPACKKDLPPHYRYCPECGCDSLFFAEGVLPSWSEEKEQAHLASFVKPNPEFPF